MLDFSEYMCLKHGEIIIFDIILKYSVIELSFQLVITRM